MAVNRFKNLDKNKTKEIIRVASQNESGLKNSNSTKASSKLINKPKKTMNNEGKKNMEKLGVSIRCDIKKRINELGKISNNIKPNTVVINLLNEIFDGKNFNVNFEKKIDSKITSYNLPSEMINAITKINIKTNIPKSEIFNKLLEEALKNYY